MPTPGTLCKAMFPDVGVATYKPKERQSKQDIYSLVRDMNADTVHKTHRLDYLMLLLILILACYIAFIPHINYPYPVHIDEWVHLAHSNALTEAGSTSYVDPFFGLSTVGGLLSPHLEAGFHLFLGTLHEITGLSWMTIFRYFPSIIFAMTALAVYILGRREGFGLGAAFFTCLIPTTVGIMGPAFLIPVSLGLLFTPLILFLAFNFRTVWSYLLIFVFISFLLLMHAPSAICPIIVLIPYILLHIKGDFKHSAGVALGLLLPFTPFPWIFRLLLPTVKELFEAQGLVTYVDLPRILYTYGYLPVAICLFGVFILAVRGGKRNYALVLGLLVMVVMLVAYFTFGYGIPVLYYRGLMFMMLMMSITAGAGLMWVGNLRLPDRISSGLRVPFITQNIGKLLCLVLVVVILVLSIPVRQSIPYYHLIDRKNYEAFVWIRDNVGDEYEKAILDPWKATAFVAITGKKVFTRIHAFPKTDDEKAYAFLNSGCRNTTFLRENKISVVYSLSPCSNPDLVMVRDNVYLLRKAE